jgi:hypothetical protein
LQHDGYKIIKTARKHIEENNCQFTETFNQFHETFCQLYENIFQFLFYFSHMREVYILSYYGKVLCYIYVFFAGLNILSI